MSDSKYSVITSDVIKSFDCISSLSLLVGTTESQDSPLCILKGHRLLVPNIYESGGGGVFAVRRSTHSGVFSAKRVS